MKTYKILYLFFSVFLITSVISCKFSSSLPVLTKDQTMVAVIGKWEHVDLKKSDVKNIVFTNKKNANGDYIYVMTYQKKDSNGNISQTGTWRYANIGKIEIWDVDDAIYVLHFNFIDRSTIALEDFDIYTKGDKPN